MNINSINLVKFKGLYINCDIDNKKRDLLYNSILNSSDCKKAIDIIEQHAMDVYIENYRTCDKKQRIDVKIKDGEYDKFGFKNNGIKQTWISRTALANADKNFCELVNSIKSNLMYIYNDFYSTK